MDESIKLNNQQAQIVLALLERRQRVVAEAQRVVASVDATLQELVASVAGDKLGEGPLLRLGPDGVWLVRREDAGSATADPDR